MDNKLNCVFVINNITGGVFSFCKNIAVFNHDENIVFSFIIVKKTKEKLDLELIKDLNFFIFEYDDISNFFYTASKLNKILTDYSVVIANDGLELKATWFNKVKTKTVFIVHGCYEYYIFQAKVYEQIIDKYFCVNPWICEILNTNLPHRIGDIKYAPVPTIDNDFNSIVGRDSITLIFVGRLSVEKGVLILQQIDDCLKFKGVVLNWLVVGNLEIVDTEFVKWLTNSENVNYLGFLNNEAVFELYKQSDLLILPSFAEGFPVVVAESMKYGVVPIINDLPGFDTMLKNSSARLVTGNKVEQYVDEIIALNSDKIELLNSKKNVLKFSKIHFSALRNVENFIFELKNLSKINNDKCSDDAVFLSRLDRKYLPNALVKIIRNFRNLLR